MNDSTITPALAQHITPDRAKEILDTANIGNRRLRMWWVMAMASAIKRGEWILTHQGIAFDEGGNLVDGQHRLHAIVQSNIAVDMFVFRGLSKRAFMTIDVGTKRNTADTTGLEPKSAEVCRYIAGLACLGAGRSSATAQQVKLVADAGVDELHGRLMQYCNSRRKGFTSAAMRAAAIILVMDGYAETDVFETYRNLALQQYKELLPVGEAFSRKVNDGKVVVNGSYDFLAHALKALNPNNAQITRINISESDASAAASYVRHVGRRALTGGIGIN